MIYPCPRRALPRDSILKHLVPRRVHPSRGGPSHPQSYPFARSSAKLRLEILGIHKILKTSHPDVRVTHVSGDTTPCRMTGVTLHSHVRFKVLTSRRARSWAAVRSSSTPPPPPPPRGSRIPSTPGPAFRVSLSGFWVGFLGSGIGVS